MKNLDLFVLTLKNNKKANQYNGYVFNVLHFYLINKPNIHIAFNYDIKNKSFLFFATNYEDLLDFKKYLCLELDFVEIFGKEILNHSTKGIFKYIEEINKYFSLQNIKKIQEKEEDLIVVKRINSSLAKISKSKLIKNIEHVLFYKPKNIDFELSGFNLKLKRVLLLLKIEKMSDIVISNTDSDLIKKEKDLILKNIQDRLKKKDNLFYIKGINFSNQLNDSGIGLNKGIIFINEFLEEKEINFKVNRYGLSTQEFIFKIPCSMQINDI